MLQNRITTTATSQPGSSSVGANASANPEGTTLLMSDALLMNISAAVAEEGQRMLHVHERIAWKLETKMENMMMPTDDAH